MIEAYALCNDWDLFGTFTLNGKYRDRKDLDGFRKDIMQFIRDCRKQMGKIEVLLVPELHKNKDGWHMHGLLQGVPVESLRLFTLQEKLPDYIRDKLKASQLVYDWPKYRQSFGFVDLEPIKNRDAAARYITKYITKGMNADAETGIERSADAIELGKHLYYPTRGLKLPERIESASGCNPEALPKDLIATNGY